MNVQHLRDIQLQPLNVFVEIHRELGWRRIGLGPRPRVERIRLNNHLLLRQIRHQQAVMVEIAPNVMKLKGVNRVSDYAILLEAIDYGAALRLSETVGVDLVRE